MESCLKLGDASLQPTKFSFHKVKFITGDTLRNTTVLWHVRSSDLDPEINLKICLFSHRNCFLAFLDLFGKFHNILQTLYPFKILPWFFKNSRQGNLVAPPYTKAKDNGERKTADWQQNHKSKNIFRKWQVPEIYGQKRFWKINFLVSENRKKNAGQK